MASSPRNLRPQGGRRSIRPRCAAATEASGHPWWSVKYWGYGDPNQTIVGNNVGHITYLNIIIINIYIYIIV